MTNLAWTSIGAQHTPAWSDLSNALAKHDDTDEFYSAEDLAEELEEPGFTAAEDSFAVWDGDAMVGYGQLRVSDGVRDGMAKAHLSGGVHPEYRGRGIGRVLMDRLEDRARVLGTERHPGIPLQGNVWANAPGSSATRLAAARGYEPARYFQDMRVDLAAWTDAAAVTAPPPGVLPFSADVAEGVRRAHNEAFADHWGSTDRTPEKWADMVASRSFRPGLGRVALAASGGTADAGGDLTGPDADGFDAVDAVDAYVLCGEWVPGALYVSLVGTRRRARGRGLAAALLTDVVRSAQREGYRTVDLGVDSDSPTGAVGLYERVGFRKVRTNVVYTRVL